MVTALLIRLSLHVYIHARSILVAAGATALWLRSCVGQEELQPPRKPLICETAETPNKQFVKVECCTTDMCNQNLPGIRNGTSTEKQGKWCGPFYDLIMTMMIELFFQLNHLLVTLGFCTGTSKGSCMHGCLLVNQSTESQFKQPQLKIRSFAFLFLNICQGSRTFGSKEMLS